MDLATLDLLDQILIPENLDVEHLRIVLYDILAVPQQPMLGELRSPHWTKTRTEHLLIEPACMICGTKKNLNVHHIKPYHKWPKLELVQKNLITLCETPGQNHHFILGHLRDWSSWNEHIREWVDIFKNRPY